MTDVFTLDENAPVESTVASQPLYRIYEGSRIAVGKAVGPMWEKRFEAALKAYELIWGVWDEVLRYYNNNQTKSSDSPRGTFKRGDGTENVVFSNINIVLPAIYSKDPDVSCSTTDREDEEFCKTMQTLINTLIRRRDKIHAKPKVKRACAFGLLTNLGVLKLDFTKKDDSREYAQQEFARLSEALGQAKDQEEVSSIYGQMEALENRMEVLKPNGPSMKNVLPHNLLIDPYAEQPDGLDGNWMMERTFISTAALNEEYTQPDPEQDDKDVPDYKKSRVYTYKPTHKAKFTEGGDRDDGLGIVMESIHGTLSVTGHTDDERTAYIDMYYTECVLIWDKHFRRVLLFAVDDWAWPIWVWDDPLTITRFFPYFIISFAISTGGTVSVGETAYYLDQQDEVNDINRQINRIRRTVFDFFFYNIDAAGDPAEIEKFIKALRGEGSASDKHLIGVRAGDKKVSEMIEAVPPPSFQYMDKLFDKTTVLDSVNRITNTSDAMRGVQFKTNTNVPAVNTYQESMRLAVGAKVDVVEDVVADIALSIGELCIQYYTHDEVIGLIGEAAAAGWQEMDLATFNTQYTISIAAGSLEKPNSIFKKKEAVEITQAVGQFATAAPGTTLTIMLRLLQNAFTDVVIKPEDWAALQQEITANLQRGVSTEQGQGQGQAQAQGQAQTQGQELPPELANLPIEIKQEVIRMKEAGTPDEAILAFIQQNAGTAQGAGGMNGY